MATIDENLQTLSNTKNAFKTQFASNNISTTNVPFTEYPSLIDDMEKKLPTQVKNVAPSESLQSISADSGYKLQQVNVSPMVLNTLLVTPSTSGQVINPPSNVNGYKQVQVDAVTSAIDSNIQAGNIKDGVTILGVTGTFEGGTDISDTTATASDVLSGKDFYLANGTKTTGTIPTYSGSSSVTQNGTLATGGKYVENDIVVNVSGITPTGTINITENGTYDVTNYASANVNVSGGGESGTDLDYIQYYDDMLQIETGEEPPTAEEYDEIIDKGYVILDYIFRGVRA